MLKPKDHHVEKTGWREIGWFIALWALGVVTVLTVGAIIKLVLGT